MRAELDVLELLISGSFAGIKPGMDKASIIEYIGQPLGWARSESGEEEVDFYKADMWGYGNWVLFFEADILNAITGSDLNDRNREYAAFEKFPGSELENLELEGVIKYLKFRNIDYYLAPKKIKYINKKDNIVYSKRRRLSCETLYVGDDLMGRVTFTNKLEVSQIAYPCGVISQVVGLKVNEKWSRKGIDLVK